MKVLGGIAAAAALTVLAGCGGAGGGATTTTAATSSTTTVSKLTQAAGNCNVGELAKDGGKTLILDGPGKTSVGNLSMDQMACIFHFLNITDAVDQHMQSTRALDGQQTDSWDTISARWTYHPDAGLDITLTEK